MLRNNKCSPLLGSFLRQSQAASRLAARPTPSVRLFGIFSKRESGRTCQSLDKQVFPFPTSKGITPLFASFKRGIVTDSQAILTRPTGREAWIRYAVAGAAIAGTIVVVDGFFNRETRSPLSPTEQSYLHSSFMYTAGGLAVTAIAARSMFRAGLPLRLMTANPWLVLGVSLAGSIGTMFGTFYTSPDNTVLKHGFWLAFNMCQAATLSPLFFFNPAVLSRAALYTCGVVGSLSYVGATATNDKYLNWGGPLLAGVTVVALSALAPMALPMGLRGLAISESISMYGGLAVFGGFILYDTQKILAHARMVERGAMKADPVVEAISLELDIFNIFIRLVQLLAGQRKK